MISCMKPPQESSSNINGVKQVMEKREIEVFIQFNFWAGDRILEACESLPFEKLKQPVTPDPGWGNLLGILVHILDAEYGWRSVLQSQSSEEILQPDDFADLAALRSRWEAERSAWTEYVRSLSPNSIKQTYGADPQHKLTVWQTIMHVVTHGIQHRSEAAAILTGLGQSPGELDFELFLWENPGT